MSFTGPRDAGVDGDRRDLASVRSGAADGREPVSSAGQPERAAYESSTNTASVIVRRTREIMDGSPERRRYYPDEENVPLSVTVREAIAAHEDVEREADEIELYDHIDPEGIDLLFTDTADADVSIRST